MKQNRMINIVLAVINVILIAVCIVLYMGADRTAPEFKFQAADVIYQSKMDKEEILAGITAYDREDGDVTDRIVIEKVTENQKDSTVVVFFAVSDRSGNVAKTSKLFQAVFEKEAENFMEAGINAELNRTLTDRESAGMETGGGIEGNLPGRESSEFPNSSGKESPVPSSSIGSVPTVMATATPSAMPTQRPLPTVIPAAVPTAQPPGEADGAAPASNQEPEEDHAGAPVLTLRTSEVKVNAGQGPAWVDIIGTLSDDKDDYDTLFRNLNVGRYDRDKPGTYQISVYTEDSDGNKSSSVPLTIVVQ